MKGADRWVWWLAGGALLAAILWGGKKVKDIYESTAQSVHPELEPFRELVCREVLRVFWDYDTATQVEIARLLMSQIWVESHGNPVAVGDMNAAVGPSVGPIQVSRGTAKDLKLWAPPAGATAAQERAAYAAMATDLSFCIHAAAVVWRAKLNAAGGDMYDAVRRYNGGGPAASIYQDKALATEAAMYPDSQDAES
ncbi:lysozyme family protein [Anaeromyxobacter paludicola]|uniref:Transglycosylase SLT domain-containing protein n=1 Tax=Anaeromyxobacter paludicola TaxID=2918171 RepID=A0ABM7X6Z3_9BACT|nr:hypothetical protein [Anaeromyxobacter paludicola]BDG07604.1 hypothetical protein AMPC_07170 [Anaeromyxobacter paludicola]